MNISMACKKASQSYMLCYIHIKTAKRLEEGNFACSDFLDFAKLIGLIDHLILLRKFEKFVTQNLIM